MTLTHSEKALLLDLIHSKQREEKEDSDLYEYEISVGLYLDLNSLEKKIENTEAVCPTH